MQLHLSDIKKSFGDKEVLKDISFTFEQGKIYGLLGRNGSGKTTLFNCLSEEIPMDTGKAEIVVGQDRTALTQDSVGYVLSTPILPDFLTGYEFVKFFIEINPDIDDSTTAEDWLNFIGIEEEDRNRLIKGYSQGMKNKLQMLLCFIAKPPIILLDEPLTSLDVVIAAEIKKLLQTLKENHILIFSTHILQLATDLCDEIVLLKDGKLELVDHNLLKSADFEKMVVEMLTDEEKEDVGHVSDIQD